MTPVRGFSGWRVSRFNESGLSLVPAPGLRGGLSSVMESERQVTLDTKPVTECRDSLLNLASCLYDLNISQSEPSSRLLQCRSKFIEALI